MFPIMDGKREREDDDERDSRGGKRQKDQSETPQVLGLKASLCVKDDIIAELQAQLAASREQVVASQEQRQELQAQLVVVTET
ncbi:hypothetical protein B484DRAFT_397231 [Ochromonadaceae sp. CCMP2298]|nr:hypothetical protein B484DRAFT_397231 [Ochromonadaceae sp. CCMP2298]